MKREKLINCTLFGVLTAVMAMFFIACAKPPVQEMSDAQAAVARAENDPDVIAYSANTLSRAKEALNNMQTEADAKRYDAAKNFANDAQNLAEKAIADAKNAVGRQKDEAANAINVMNNALTATEDLLQGARSSGGQGLDINSLDRDFTEARTTAQEAEQANSESRYREAIERSQNARTALSAISTAISQATIAVSRKK